MTNVTLSRFDKSARSFTLVDPYLGCMNTDTGDCSPIGPHMEGLIRQLRKFPGEPTGWSFASWTNGTNHLSNYVESNAIVLEYQMTREDTDIINRVHDKAKAMGWAFFLIDTENKRGNTLSVVWPITKGINDKQFVRLASIFAEEMDEYLMAEASIAATHIIQVHRETTPVVFQGKLLDAHAEIKRTAKLYQRLDARKYEGPRPARRSAAPITSVQFVEDDMFSWPVSAAEQRQMDGEALLRSIGVNL